MKKILFAAVLASACAGSPTAPATTPPPPPLPDAVLQAGGDLGAVSTPDGYRLTGTFTNVGVGCASSIAGNLRIRDAAGMLLATLPWALDPAAVLGPQQQAMYTACCYKTTAPDLFYSVTFTFTSVKC